MGDIKGFLKVKRVEAEHRPKHVRVKDFKEVAILRPGQRSQEQASRCMDCGTPFCHWGCPIGNLIPEWNDLVFAGHWEKAFEFLDATNNLPEITGRVCPAPCEYACVLGINDDPVTIKENELSIIERAFEKKIIKPRAPHARTNKTVAVIGSGPAGLVTADQLNRAGHLVTVFERDDLPGGILRYGIPDFKLEKWVLDRRVKLLEKAGITFVTKTHMGVDYAVAKLKEQFDAIVLACGSRVPRDIRIEGRDLAGVHFAMEYLIQSNKRVAKYKIPKIELIDAKGKRVVVIGGGDTGADCVGTAHRQGACHVTQIEVMPRPPECRDSEYPWPKYPMLLKTSTSHEEGGERQWSILTKKFIGSKGKLIELECVRVEFNKDVKGCPIMKEVPGSEFKLKADLITLAVGFLHPEHSPLTTDLGVEYDTRGNVATDANFMTNVKGVFSAGDMHRGQSLIVWAIAEGRRAAHHVDTYLQGKSNLPIV